MISFYLGGARSGKSSRALDQAGQGIFIATAEAVDDEFRTRITQHQSERGAQWQTLECPLELVQALRSFSMPTTVVIDCLTVWLGNLMHYGWCVDEQLGLLVSELQGTQHTVFIVSNEVGQGVVPEHPMGREFRDLQGRLNQRVAAISDRVELLVAGIPLVVKC